jgi:hypothetical protein
MKQGAESLKAMLLYFHKKVTEEDDQDHRFTGNSSFMALDDCLL